jgi:methylated-DNA-[protein]-cysteine S-methyltransferase
MNHLQLQVGIGTLGVTWTSTGLLSRLDWLESLGSPPSDTHSWRAVFKGELPEYLGDLLDEIRAYFLRGEPIRSVPWDHLDRQSWTEFQTKVYTIISQIPHGETRTYSWVAQRIGPGMASRAVGQALRKNPLPILIPCHRVVGAAALGGFMGRTDPQQPELLLKRRLLDLEGSYRNPVFPFLTTQWLQQPLMVSAR